MSEPRDRTFSIFSTVHLISYSVAYNLLSFMSMNLFNPVYATSSDPDVLGSLFLLQLFLTHLPLNLLQIAVRAKISKFSDEKLHKLLDRRVLLCGLLAIILMDMVSVDAMNCVYSDHPPVPELYSDDVNYITGKTVECHDHNGNKVQCDSTYYYCGAYLYSQFSITLLISAIFGVYLFIAPLTGHGYTIRNVRIFSGLPTKVKFQMGTFFVIILCNIMLNRRSSDGPCYMEQFVMFAISCVGILVLMLSEGVAIATDVRREIVARTNAPANKHTNPHYDKGDALRSLLDQIFVPYMDEESLEGVDAGRV